jgi:hypothetical protein
MPARMHGYGSNDLDLDFFRLSPHLFSYAMTLPPSICAAVRNLLNVSR